MRLLELLDGLCTAGAAQETLCRCRTEHQASQNHLAKCIISGLWVPC